MKVDKRWATAFLFCTILISALAISFKDNWKVWASEATWKISTLVSLVVAWIRDAAPSTMGYFNENSDGIFAMVAVIGLVVNIYFKFKHPKEDQD